MKTQSKFHGILPAFYACYDDAGEISPARVKALATWLVARGVNGLYVGGSSGECIYQTVRERKLVLESVMEAVGGQTTVIAHVACNGVAESRELAKHAESLGVDAIASIPPIYFHLPENAIAEYWNAISAAAPATPFIVYNIPQLAGVALTPSLLTEMLGNPNVIGVKNSSMPAMDIQTWKQLGGDGFVVFNGPDEQLAAGLASGADGGIGGTYGAMPELYLKLYALFGEGKVAEACALQSELLRVIYKLCTAKGNLYSLLKALLRARGVEVGDVRSPLPRMTAGDQAIVDEAARMIAGAAERFEVTM